MWEEDQKSKFESSEEGILEWEVGLPSADDLTPLSQALIPTELASAFSISPEPYGSMLDVYRASQNTISSLRRHSCTFSNNLTSLPSFSLHGGRGNSFALEGEETCNDADSYPPRDGNESRKGRKLSERDTEEADSALRTENLNDDQAARTLKRPRLVWTPQLHKRFVDVVAHLGIKNAVPKTIMQLMNVEGLSRENVASHLQKYRLYLKRMQGLSNEGPSSSDHLFASTPVPQSHTASSLVPGHREESRHVPLPMSYAAPLLPVPVLGVPPGHGHMTMPVNNPSVYHGFESHPYNAFGRLVPHRMSSGEQQRDWSGNKFNSIMSCPPLTPYEK